MRYATAVLDVLTRAFTEGRAFMKQILWVTPGDFIGLRRTILSETASLFLKLSTIVAQNRRTNMLLRAIGEKMGAFEDAMVELAGQLDEITSGWAVKLEAAEVSNADLRERLAAAGLPDDEFAIEENARHAAVVQALIVKLREAGTDESAPIDATPLPDVDEVEPVEPTDPPVDPPLVDTDPTVDPGEIVSDPGGVPSDPGGEFIAPIDETPPLSDDVPDEAPAGTTPDFTPDPDEKRFI